LFKSTIKTICCVEYTGPLTKQTVQQKMQALINIFEKRTPAVSKSESCDDTDNAQIQRSKEDDATHNIGTDKSKKTQENESEISEYYKNGENVWFIQVVKYLLY